MKKKKSMKLYSAGVPGHIAVNMRGGEERKCEAPGRFFICPPIWDLATSDMGIDIVTLEVVLKITLQYEIHRLCVLKYSSPLASLGEKNETYKSAH